MYQYQTYTLGNKLVIFDTYIRYETYENQSYYGIIFFIDNEGNSLICKDAKYDIVHHYHMDWERLIINDKEGWKDLPFNEGTYRFLPNNVRILEI